MNKNNLPLTFTKSRSDLIIIWLINVGPLKLMVYTSVFLMEVIYAHLIPRLVIVLVDDVNFTYK